MRLRVAFTVLRFLFDCASFCVVCLTGFATALYAVRPQLLVRMASV